MATKANRDKAKKARPGFQSNFTKLENETKEAIHLVQAVPRDFAEFTDNVKDLEEKLSKTAEAFDRLYNGHQAVLEHWDASQGPDPEAEYMEQFQERWENLQRDANKAVDEFLRRKAEEERRPNSPSDSNDQSDQVEEVEQPTTSGSFHQWRTTTQATTSAVPYWWQTAAASGAIPKVTHANFLNSRSRNLAQNATATSTFASLLSQPRMTTGFAPGYGTGGATGGLPPPGAQPLQAPAQPPQAPAQPPLSTLSPVLDQAVVKAKSGF